MRNHDNVIKWKHFPRYWPLVRGIHRSSVNFPHKGQWRGALMFSLIFAWINGWVNNSEAGDLSVHRVHYDVIMMFWIFRAHHSISMLWSIYYNVFHSRTTLIIAGWGYGHGNTFICPAMAVKYIIHVLYRDVRYIKPLLFASSFGYSAWPLQKVLYVFVEYFATVPNGSPAHSILSW